MATILARYGAGWLGLQGDKAYATLSKEKTIAYFFKCEIVDGEEDTEEEAQEELEDLANALLAGAITLIEFQQRGRNIIEEYTTRAAIIARGTAELSEDDLGRLNQFIRDRVAFWDAFVIFLRDNAVDAAIGAATIYSILQTIWRAGLYSNLRSVFEFFSMPFDMANSLPVLPGEDCLGRDMCGCQWVIEEASAGVFHCYWVLNPQKDHCEVCLEHEAEWQPYIMEL